MKPTKHMRLLVIEDDQDIRETLRSNLEAECFAVDVAEDGEQGSFLARTNDYDVILLDYMLPKMDGMAVCAAIRNTQKSPYVIMLSVRAEVETKIQLLDVGADDYLTKPFSFDELLARIHALMRRPLAIQPNVLSHEHVVMDVRSHVVTSGGQEIYLTRKEFMLLEYLLRQKGAVVTRSMLAEHVWDTHLNIFSNTIESHILTLRKKIDNKKKPGLIHTIPGRGYRIGGTSILRSVPSS